MQIDYLESLKNRHYFYYPIYLRKKRKKDGLIIHQSIINQ